jgi:D-beta-D-heptose 7-phosphate kinase/D-beta-D-heptose 1-phosphate adenosyltransferase
MQSKIQTLQRVSKICKKLKAQGKTIGLITGCFDVFHIGHLQSICFAKTKCDTLVIGIDNDKSVKLSKGSKRPIFTARQRALVMGG